MDFEYLVNKKNEFIISSDYAKYTDPEADIIVGQPNSKKEKLRFKVNDKDFVISTKEKKEKQQNISVFIAENHPFCFSVAFRDIRPFCP